MIGRTPQAHVGNVTSLTIIVSFSKINIKTVHNVLSFPINSSPKWVQRRVTDTVMMLVYICSTQARLRKLTSLWCDPLSLSLSLSHTHTHACCFLWVPGNLHRHNGFNTVQTVCAIALHLNLALTGDGAFLLSLQKTHSVWFIRVLNYENVLINHLLLVIPMSYPCHYTNLCPHKPHKHAHTQTHDAQNSAFEQSIANT